MSNNGTKPTYPVDIYTQKEQDRLKDFRLKVADLNLTPEQLEDAQLIRWLRARSLDTGKAYDMLKASIQWRRENQIDGILERESVPAEFEKQCPFANLGLDKDGYPIFLVPMGRHDTRALLEKYGLEECMKYNMINMEKIIQHLDKLSKEQGRPVTQFVEIIDLEGFSYRQLTSKLCREFMTRMQTTFDANHPELLRFAIGINAPKVFYILFNMLKPFIPKETLEKVDLYGPEPEKWRKVIAERFPAEKVPPHWGGTLKGSDEYCSKESIWVQGPVPVSFFKNGSLYDEEALTAATVNARDSLKITVNVTKAKSCIAWTFRVISHDIGFQILDQSGKVILPFSRIQSQTQVQEGTQVCDEVGIYTVVFDNSYSVTRSKTVRYSVAVIEQEEAAENGHVINPA